MTHPEHPNFFVLLGMWIIITVIILGNLFEHETYIFNITAPSLPAVTSLEIQRIKIRK